MQLQNAPARLGSRSSGPCGGAIHGTAGSRFQTWQPLPPQSRALKARRVFLTVGGRSLQAFEDMPDVWFLARMTDAPPSPPPLANAEYVVARGPFQTDAEIALMRTHAIDLLIAKASGGAATEAKIHAARALDIPTVIIRRPPAPPGDAVADAEGALAWLNRLLAG